MFIKQLRNGLRIIGANGIQEQLKDVVGTRRHKSKEENDKVQDTTKAVFVKGSADQQSTVWFSVLYLLQIQEQPMIDLDYDELNQTATYLLGKVVECVPRRFSTEETIEFRTLVFNKLIKFVRADVPCDIKTSLQLFEQCLKTSELGNFPSVPQFTSIEQSLPDVFKQMNFSLFAGAPNRSSQKQKLDWVQNEMLRTHQAVAENRPYRNQKFTDDILSIEADTHNKKILEGFFEKAKKSNVLYNATPRQLAQYVEPVIKQTQTLQNQLASNWDLSGAIHKRRLVTPIDDDLDIPGYFFK